MHPVDAVVTPEAVVLDFETAGLASRLLAGLIDVAAQGVLLFVVLIAAAGLATGFSSGGAAGALVYVAVFLVLFGYPAVLETLWRGRTLGKAAMGLRVVTAEGMPVRFRHAAIRSMMGLVDKWSASGAIGVVTVLLTRRNQRLGDLVAGTIVLRERRSSRPLAAIAFAAPPGLERYCATLDVAGLSRRDYVAIRSFLLRAHTLRPDLRFTLARELSRPLQERLRATVPADLHPEVWLACVLAAQQSRSATLASARSTSVWDDLGGEDPPPPLPTQAPDAAGGYPAPA